MDKVQGPRIPVCVGAHFSTHQVLTGGEAQLVGPLLFDSVGHPQFLLSTMQQSLPFDDTLIEPHTQAKCYARRDADSYVPRDLLYDHIKEDFSLKLNMLDQLRNRFGNRLQYLKCRDSKLILLFPTGEAGLQLGSVLLSPGISGRWNICRDSLTHNKFVDEGHSKGSGKSSFCHPIRQVSAIAKDIWGSPGSDDFIVAARTCYEVKFCAVSRQEQQARFVSTASSQFRTPVSHVAWNLQQPGETAVVLRNGNIHVFDMEQANFKNANPARESIAYSTFSDSESTLLHSSNDAYFAHVQDAGCNNRHGKEDGEINTEDRWWQCEFGWHPKSLLVASSDRIICLDLRVNNSLDDTWYQANVGRNAQGRAFAVLAKPVGQSAQCWLKPSHESFVAFSRAEYDGMYEYAAATKQHLMLYDCRKPQCPVLQWEHGMSDDAPGFITMVPLSVLRPILRTNNLCSYNGRAIIATNFHSGDMSIFTYGISNNCSKVASGSKRKEPDWDSSRYAWQLPSRLFVPNAVEKNWTHTLGSPDNLFIGNNLVDNSSGGAPGDSLSGLVFVPGDRAIPVSSSYEEDTRHGFSLVQITGYGEILSQRYQAFLKLDGLAQAVGKDIGHTPDGLHICQKKKDLAASKCLKSYDREKDPLCELLPAFLSYFWTGSCQRFEVCKNMSLKTHTDEVEVPGELEGYTGGNLSNSLEKRNSHQAESLLTPILPQNKQSYQATISKILRAFLKQVKMPLSVFEIAHKVLRMVPTLQLAPLAAGMPSDLAILSHRGYPLPVLSPILFAEQCEESSTQGIFGVSQAKKVVPVNRHPVLPLPFLLELQNHSGIEGNWLDSQVYPSISTKQKNIDTDPLNLPTVNQRTLGNSTRIDVSVDTDVPGGSEKMDAMNADFVQGHAILFQGCNIVGEILEKLAVKVEAPVISLMDRPEPWSAKDAQPRDGLHHNIHMLHIPGRNFISSSEVPCRVEIFSIPTVVKEKYSHVRHAAQSTVMQEMGQFGSDVFCKFAWGEWDSTIPAPKQEMTFSKLDSYLCPIELEFPTSDANLEADEWAEIVGLGSQLKQWQSSFPPCRGIL